MKCYTAGRLCPTRHLKQDRSASRKAFTKKASLPSISSAPPFTKLLGTGLSCAGRMLFFLLHSPGFTPGVHTARSARSPRESPVAMRVVDLGGVPIEEFASYRARFPEVAEAFERLESTLQEIDKIEQQNIQKRVSCPEPAPRLAHSAPSPPQVSPKLWRLQEERIASNEELNAQIDSEFKALTRSLLELLESRSRP